MYGKSNVAALVAGVVSFSLFLTVACVGISVFLPAEDGAEHAQVEQQVGETAEEIAEFIDADETLFFDESLFAEIDVSGQMILESAKDRVDSCLVLYRQPQSKLAVEWFYSQVAGDRDVALAILEAAEQFDISPALAFSLAYAESLYKADAVHVNLNGSVDRGLFQLNSNSFPKLAESDFFDARTSAYHGMSHLHYCIQSAGNEIAGLAMYNAGRTKVQDNKTPQTTLNYISKIENYKMALEDKFASEILAFYSTGNGTTIDKVLAKY